jgi:hypothetical protein
MRTCSIRVLLCLLALTPATWACGLPQPRLVCQEYFVEQVVVVAKLARVRHVGPIRSGQMDGNYYYFEVIEKLKGKILRRFQVYEENTAERAPFEWKRGEEYLLFISYSNQDRGWELDGCGNSTRFSDARKVLREIGRINSGKSLERIEGFIASDQSLPRVTVKVEGGAKSYTVVSENREFKLRLEPGTYVVTPILPGWQFEKDALSYDDPQKIRIEPGQCAQVQFQAKQAPVAASR